MDHRDTFSGGEPGPGDPPLPLGRAEGVLRRRLVAYLIDIAAIFVVTALLGLLVGIVGFLTFGLGWGLYAVLAPGTALLYSAATVGGARQATFGMRATGLAVHDAGSGGPPGFWVAGAHALLFYVAASTFLLLVADAVIGLMRADRRLGHDLVAGLVVLRRPA